MAKSYRFNFQVIRRSNPKVKGKDSDTGFGDTKKSAKAQVIRRWNRRGFRLRNIT